MNIERKHWTPEEDALLVKMIQEGENIKGSHIAKVLGRAKSSTMKRIRDLGYCNFGRIRRMSNQDAETIRKMLENGKTYNEISSVVKFSARQVRAAAKRYRLKSKVSAWDNHMASLVSAMIEDGKTLNILTKHLRCTKKELVAKLKKEFGNNMTPKMAAIVQEVDQKAEIIKSKLWFTKSRCKKVERDNDLTYEFLLELLEKQHGKCYYTGEEITFERYSPNVFSIDRKDSSKGYTRDNVVICIWDINRMKQDMPIDRLVELCEIIVANKSAITAGLYPIETQTGQRQTMPSR